MTEPIYGQCGIRHGGGVIPIRAFVENLGTCAADVKGKIRKGSTQKDETTKAEHRDGVVSSSVEASETMWSEGTTLFILNQRSTTSWEES